MRAVGVLVAAIAAVLPLTVAAQPTPAALPDIVTIVSMAVTDLSGAPVERWTAQTPLRGVIRFAIGGREGEEVPVIVRVALEGDNSSEVSWADIFDGRLAPGEQNLSWDFTVPAVREARLARLVWSVKARYYVRGKLLNWVLANHSSQPLDFDGKTIREIRANPALSGATRESVWVRNRQADRTYPIEP